MLAEGTRHIAFNLVGGGIGRLRSDGTEFTRIADFGRETDWCRCGGLIVFREGATLYFMDAWDTLIRPLRTGGIDDDPAWSPDGREIAVQEDGIVIVTFPGGDLERVPCQDPPNGLCQGEGPTWSPDSRTIYFDSNRSGRSEIWKVRFDP